MMTSFGMFALWALMCEVNGAEGSRMCVVAMDLSRHPGGEG